MPRRLRPQIAGAFYHITMRGNARQLIYLLDEDCQMFLDLLAEVAERYGWHVHAYCLMDNHYHLVVQTPEANIGDGMRYLNSMYARKFNKRHGLSGHLFERRYHCEVIKSDEQLLNTMRYVALNPVRVPLVRRPELWKWSSYAAAVGLVPAPRFLVADWLRSQFSSIAELERWVMEGLKPLPTPQPWR
jgi:REP element-mobilizing transposase RayT